jgi:hypothetical protein
MHRLSVRAAMLILIVSLVGSACQAGGVRRTALREDTRTAPQAKGRNYDLSTGLHTYGVIYPAGLRRPELVPTGTQTAFRHYETISWEGERQHAQCEQSASEKFHRAISQEWL